MGRKRQGHLRQSSRFRFLIIKNLPAMVRHGLSASQAGPHRLPALRLPPSPPKDLSKQAPPAMISSCHRQVQRRSSLSGELLVGAPTKSTTSKTTRSHRCALRHRQLPLRFLRNPVSWCLACPTGDRNLRLVRALWWKKIRSHLSPLRSAICVSLKSQLIDCCHSMPTLAFAPAPLAQRGPILFWAGRIIASMGQRHHG